MGHKQERTFLPSSSTIRHPEQLSLYVPGGIFAALGFLVAGAPQAHTHITIAAIITATLQTVLDCILGLYSSLSVSTHSPAKTIERRKRKEGII